MSRRDRRRAAWNVRHSWLHYFVMRHGGREARIIKSKVRSMFNAIGSSMAGATRSSVNKRRRHAKRHGRKA